MEGYRLIGAKNCILGEGPLWCKEKNTLFHLDIEGKCLYAIDWNSGKTQKKELPQKTGCMAFAQDGSMLFAMENGIYGENGCLLHQETAIAGIRFNDGKAGPDGSFYAGTIHRSGKGKLYRFNEGRLETVIDGVSVSNGLDWSADEKTMYYCDTPTGKIMAYRFPEMTECRCVIEIPEEMGHPDGLCTDADGNLWIALWGGGAVIHVDAASGEILQKIDLPVSKVSCPCFAGAGLQELVVTTAAENMDLKAEPLAGCTFVIPTDVKGKLPYRVG